MFSRKLKEFLDGHEIEYEVISHSLAYTSQEIAASAHIPGKNLAKTVVVKIDDKMAMAVLPASYRVDFELLKNILRCQGILNPIDHSPMAPCELCSHIQVTV